MISKKIAMQNIYTWNEEDVDKESSRDKEVSKSMRYIIMQKAKSYPRIRRGKFEQVKGYPGQEPSVKEASGVSAERKEAAPFTKQKRSSPGDGLKSLKDYPTVHDLGHAVYKELDVIQMWSKPTGFGGFAVGYEKGSKSMIISYNEPRELRHPEDYNFPEYELSNARAKYREVDEQVHKVVEKLKDMGVRVAVAYDSSGASWIVNRPKESDFVKSEVKGYTRVRQGKMERVQPFQRVGEARVIYHTPSTIEKIKGVIKDLIGKIKGWKTKNKGFLTKEQRKYIQKRVKELKSQVGKQKLTTQQQTILRNALSQMRKELEVKSKLAEHGQTLPLPKKKLSREELGAKRKKGYEAYLSRKREEKKGKEVPEKETREDRRKKGYEAWLAKKRKEKKGKDKPKTKLKKYPGIPPKGLKKEEFTGLIGAGYSRREIVKMGSNAAKAAYWNDVKPDEHKDVQSNAAELHYVISKN